MLFRSEWEGKELWVTVSVGFVSFSNELSAVEEMIALADICLYEAKRTGKNKVVEHIGQRGEL